MSAPLNPPAFPRTGEGLGNPRYDEAGMRLRDYFAGQAVVGLIAQMDVSSYARSVDTEDWSFEAGDAYAIADAMLIARGEV